MGSIGQTQSGGSPEGAGGGLSSIVQLSIFCPLSFFKSLLPGDVRRAQGVLYRDGRARYPVQV